MMPVPRVRTGAAAAAVIRLLLTDPAGAQVPWAERPTMEADFQRYSAEVFVELNRELQAWGAAWMRGGSAELGRFYMEDATLTLVDGTRVSGREEITRRLRAFAPASGSFHSGVYDFALGGTLAYTRGWFQVDGATPAHGEIVTVFRERSGRWQILYQTFVDRE